MDTREGSVTVGGLKLHYQEWGRPDGMPIVMLHGLRSYGATWEPVAEAIGPQWRTIGLDQRGRGDSDWDAGADYYTEAYVRDLEGFVEAMGLKRFVLLGHSMGGSNAMYYAGRGNNAASLRGVIIEDIGPGSSTSTAGAERIIAELRKTPESFATWAEARAFWRSQRPLVSEAALDSRVRYSMRERDGRVFWKYDYHGIAKARMNPDLSKFPDLWPGVRAIACPGLVIRGELSDFLPVATAQKMVEANPRLSFAQVAKASHYVHDDNFEGFLAVLKPWLDALPA